MKLRRELSDLPFAGALVPYGGDLTVDGHYDGCHFTGGTVFTAARAEHGHFMECAFTEVTLENVNARRSRFSDVWLRDVRLLSVELAATSWLDATFIGCSAAGVQAEAGP
jgi:Pentapeptide repeats (9 copies)